MNMDTKINWAKYVLDSIETRSETNLTPSELYFNLFKIEIGDSNAKKRFTGIRNYLKTTPDCKDSVKVDLSAHESFEMNKNGEHIISQLVEASKEDMKSPERVMELLGYDPLKWEVVNSKYSTWNGGRESSTLYSIKCQVKPKTTKVSTNAIESLVKRLDFSHIEIPEYTNLHDGKLMLEIPIVDVHFNKISEDYNVKKCKKQYLKVINDFIVRTASYDIGKVVFPIGQDFFNSDSNLNNMTTKGTVQDNDLEHDQMFEQGVQLLIDGIELLRKNIKAPIEILLVAGNHDTLISYYAVYLLKMLYQNTKDVIVNSDMTNRKYVEFGKVLIGYTHGHKERAKLEKENVMQIEQSEAWGRTCFREWHMGHLHHEHVKEVGGIKYRLLNSMTGHDKWHVESGYVGSLRMAQAFLWHKDYGLIEIYNSPIVEE